MIRSAILASAIALAAGAAQAQPAPQLVGGGEDAVLVYPEGSRNIVGGAGVRLSGGGADRSFVFGSVQAQPGRDVAVIGGGQDRQFLPVASRPLTLAQGR